MARPDGPASWPGALPFWPRRFNAWPPGENFCTKSPSKSTTHTLPSASTATPLGAVISLTAPRAINTCQGELVTTTAVGPATPGVGVRISGPVGSSTFRGASAPKVGNATGVTSPPAAGGGPGGGADPPP